MAGKDVGTDGTMKDYCDVLRTKGEDAAIGVEVLRFDTSEVLRGEFNGKELVQAFSFADELGTSDTAAGSDLRQLLDRHRRLERHPGRGARRVERRAGRSAGHRGRAGAVDPGEP